jgi:hypothetical protein
VRNATNIRRWLLTGLLNGVFGGQSDNLLRDTRKVLLDHAGEADFPLDALNAEIATSGRTSSFDEAAVESFLSITYGRQASFLALSLLYDDNSWGTMAFQQDHIFPQALFTPKRIAISGLSEEKQARFRELVNCIGNLQLLLPHENQAKSDEDFKTWLTTRDQDYRRRHLIPDDINLHSFEKFEEFVLAREKLIRQRLKSILTPGSGPAGV